LCTFVPTALVFRATGRPCEWLSAHKPSAPQPLERETQPGEGPPEAAPPAPMVARSWPESCTRSPTSQIRSDPWLPSNHVIADLPLSVRSDGPNAPFPPGVPFMGPTRSVSALSVLGDTRRQRQTRVTKSPRISYPSGPLKRGGYNLKSCSGEGERRAGYPW